MFCPWCDQNDQHSYLYTGYPVSVSGMITLPVSSSVYQTMVANIQHLHTNSDGTLCITPMQVQNKTQLHNNNFNSNAVKVARTIMSTHNTDTIIRSSSDKNNRNNNSMACLIPKVEHADADHTQAIVDSDGNIIIRLGDNEPIKIECDSEATNSWVNFRLRSEKKMIWLDKSRGSLDMFL